MKRDRTLVATVAVLAGAMLACDADMGNFFSAGAHDTATSGDEQPSQPDRAWIDRQYKPASTAGVGKLTTLADGRRVGARWTGNRVRHVIKRGEPNWDFVYASNGQLIRAQDITTKNGAKTITVVYFHNGRVFQMRRNGQEIAFNAGMANYVANASNELLGQLGAANPRTPASSAAAAPAQPAAQPAPQPRAKPAGSLRRARFEYTFAVSSHGSYTWVQLKLDQPNGEPKLIPVGSYSQNCQEQKNPRAIHELNCYFAGAGDKLTLTQQGSRLLVTHLPYSEQANGTAKVVRTVQLNAGDRTILAAQ